MSYSVAPLSEKQSWGAAVTGLTSEALDDPAVRKSLYDLWIDKGLVLFRGLSGEEEHIKLSLIFGKPEIHPLIAHRRETHPQLVDIRYESHKAQLFEVHGEVRGAWLPWHSDLIYGARINRGGILRALEIPKKDGQTGFIDQIAVYESLPEDVKAKIEGLNVLYRLQLDCSKVKYAYDPDVRMVRKMDMFDEIMGLHSTRRSIHPLVFTQEETGRKVLNLSPWFADGIEGMENAEGDELIEYLIHHSTQPDNAYYHEWQLEDMMLWDNWRMLHSAVGVEVDESRRLQRTTLHGDYALGRWEGENTDQRTEVPSYA